LFKILFAEISYQGSGHFLFTFSQSLLLHVLFSHSTEHVDFIATSLFETLLLGVIGLSVIIICHVTN